MTEKNIVVKASFIVNSPMFFFLIDLISFQLVDAPSVTSKNE